VIPNFSNYLRISAEPVLENIKKDWNDLMQKQETTAKKDALKYQLQSVVNKLISEINNPTSTSSTVINANEKINTTTATATNT